MYSCLEDSSVVNFEMGLRLALVSAVHCPIHLHLLGFLCYKFGLENYRGGENRRKEMRGKQRSNQM